MNRLSQIFTFALILALAPMAHADKSAAADLGNNTLVEKRITDLHKLLKITADQETSWTAVAQEMRDSSTTFNEATRAREDKAKTMSAIDDLNSYADLAALHAESMKKFVTTFSPLYAAMSDDQKKNADSVFRDHKESKKKTGGK